MNLLRDFKKCQTSSDFNFSTFRISLLFFDVYSCKCNNSEFWTVGQIKKKVTVLKDDELWSMGKKILLLFSHILQTTIHLLNGKVIEKINQ